MSRVVWRSCFLVALLSVLLAANYDRLRETEVVRALQLLWREKALARMTRTDWTCEKPVDGEADVGVGSCRLTGTVNDCSCDFRTVNRVNAESLYPLISKLTRTPFFKYFKVNLWCDCPLWPDDGMCVLQACSVCECEDGEVPQPWIDDENNTHQPCNTSAIEREFAVDRSMEAEVKQRLINLPGWRGFNNPWMPEDDSEVDYSYINLMVNPERFTGYKVQIVTCRPVLRRGCVQGENPRRVWQAIYSQSCFADSLTPNNHTCAEKRVFYKLISGLHASITAHVVQEMLLDEENNVWGPNLEMFKWTLGNPNVSDRVDNLYFTFLFVLRAVTKAGDFLKAAHYRTGDPGADAETLKLVKELVDMPQLMAACPVPFDEGRLWKGGEGPELRQQLQDSFHNITKIMDCVGCEKCKLWGKLQMLGLATALKVLFQDVDCTAAHAGDRLAAPFILERNEVIALVNLLERLSEGIETYRTLSIKLEERDQALKADAVIQ